MDASSAEGKNLDLAVEQATTVMKAMRRGCEVSVIQTGGRPAPVFDQPIFDPPLMIDRVRQLTGGVGASQMPEALDLAFATLRGMSHAGRELIVISDFQSSDWTVKDDSFSQQIRAQLDSADFPPSLTLLRVGRATTGNVSVDGLELSRFALGVGQELLIRANVKNHGADPYEKARVTLFVDSAEDSVSQVDLDAGAVTQVLFSCRFETPGSHVLAVELGVDDPLATDNHAAAAVNVWDRIDVVLVDGAPSSQPLQGEADFLSVALTPFTLGRLKLADLIQTKTIVAADLRADTVKGARVVVLANVPKLSAEQLSDLTDYVRAGGSLLVFPGDRIDVSWYNDAFFADRGGLLPLPFAEAIGITGADSHPAHIVSQHFDHPALEIFNEPANGDLSTADIRRWYRLGQVSDAAAAVGSKASENGPVAPGVDSAARPPDLAELTVLARLDSGDPFLVQKRVEDGVVAQAATACDADWSDLPMRPIYLPLMQQLVVSLASQVAPPQNISTGEPIVAVFRGVPGDVPLSLTTPDGDRFTAIPSESGGPQRGPVPRDSASRCLHANDSRRRSDPLRGSVLSARVGFDPARRRGIRDIGRSDAGGHRASRQPTFWIGINYGDMDAKCGSSPGVWCWHCCSWNWCYSSGLRGREYDECSIRRNAALVAWRVIGVGRKYARLALLSSGSTQPYGLPAMGAAMREEYGYFPGGVRPLGARLAPPQCRRCSRARLDLPRRFAEYGGDG